MKPQDYKAIQIFVTEVDKRFMGMEQTIRNFVDIIKKNRDAIERIQFDIDELEKMLQEGKKDNVEVRQAIQLMNGRVNEVSTELQQFENTMVAMNELNNALDDDGQPTPLSNAVNKMVQSNQPANQAVPQQAQTAAIPHPVAPPMPEPPKDAEPEHFKQDHIYTKDELMDINWHELKKIAGSLGCKNIKGDREFYSNFILHQQARRMDGVNNG